MALVEIRNLSADTRLGIWKIEESVEDFFHAFPYLSNYRKQVETEFRYDGRRQEFLAIRALLHEMLGDSVEITHNADGKPMLEGWNLSISHTKGYACLIMSEIHEVAVDIEYRSDRVQKILQRFIRPDEKASTLDMQLLHWCAKEAVYKYFSAEDLKFFEMRIHNVSSFQCVVDNLRTAVSVDVEYENTENYMLTYIFG